MRFLMLILLAAITPDLATAQARQATPGPWTPLEKITGALTAAPQSLTAQASVVDWPRSREGVMEQLRRATPGND